MNKNPIDAMQFICPVISQGVRRHCVGDKCFWWQWDQPMYDGPDSYVADPPPTGHCGAIKGEQ